MRLILASGSARRRDLITLMGYDFSVSVSNADEDIPFCEAGRYVESLALAKASTVFEQNPSDCVLGCDTVVYLDGNIIGKPADAADACRILRTLSGREHTVYTGVAVLCPAGRQVFHDETKVRFRILTDDEIKAYVSTGEPLDKAGAYGVQGPGCLLVDSLSGNYFNVIGLPVPKVYDALARCGILPRWMRES